MVAHNENSYFQVLHHMKILSNSSQFSLLDVSQEILSWAAAASFPEPSSRWDFP